MKRLSNSVGLFRAYVKRGVSLRANTQVETDTRETTRGAANTENKTHQAKKRHLNIQTGKTTPTQAETD